MDLDLKAIAPRADGKHSPLLHKWLVAQKRRHFPATHVFQSKEDTIEGRITWADKWRPRELIIGRGDFYPDGRIEGIGGRCIGAIITGERGARSQSFWYGQGFGLRDITAEFWAEYLRAGRCAWDPDHHMGMVGDERRWHYHSGGHGRTCQWCGFEQEMRVKRRVEVVEKVIETWVPYRSSVLAAVSWPRGSMGEEI